jgi:RNA polymerase sigma-70 factor, ECF subfamily
VNPDAAVLFPEVLGRTSTDGRSPEHGQEKSPLGVEHGSLNRASELGDVAFLETQTDEQLMEAVAGGTKEALAILFHRYGIIVRNVSWRILRHEAEADDLVQEVFIFLFRKAALFKATHGSARSWIVQVTYHRAFNRRCYLNTRHFYTSQDSEQIMLTASQRQSEKHFVEWSLEGVWGKESAAKLRDLLSPSQLLTIQLHFFEGYTLDEIADRLGQKLANVRHHYYRGLEKLRRPAFADKLRTK